jgi:hypothetical protein
MAHLRRCIEKNNPHVRLRQMYAAVIFPDAPSICTILNVLQERKK